MTSERTESIERFEGLSDVQKAALVRFISVMPYLFDTSLTALQKEMAEEEHQEAAEACMDTGLTKQICQIRDKYNVVLLERKSYK